MAVLRLLFQFGFLLFLSSLASMTRIYKIILNKSGASGHPCLVPDLPRKAFSFPPLGMMFAVDMSYGFYYVELSSLYPHFLESFFIKGCWFFVKKLFLHILRWSYGFILQSVTVVYHTDLQILKNSCIPRINLIWSWYMILVMYCWIQFANILLWVFASAFISDIHL